MMKADEIKLLDKMIREFGPNSYLGPWLADARLQIEADIKSDVCIEVKMPNAARLEAHSILEDARQEAAKIREAAEAFATERRNGVAKHVDEVRLAARRELERLAAKL
jgi:hypothetical protein